MTQVMVRPNELIYNWWSVFVRLPDTETRRAAKTSRPLMMDGAGRVPATPLESLRA